MDETQVEENLEVARGIGDQINFIELFRVKGYQGLYTLNSTVHKSGMVSMLKLLEFNQKITVHENKLECLGQLEFITFAGYENLRMGSVFNNMFEYLEETGDDIDDLSWVELMHIMAPNHDPYFFKQSHAKKCLAWYKEITTKFNEFKEKEDGSDNDKD
jgi:hypothetical protein